MAAKILHQRDQDQSTNTTNPATPADARRLRAKLASGGAVGWKDLGKGAPSPYRVAVRAIADAHRLAASIEGADAAVDEALGDLISKLCDLRGDLERDAALAGELANPAAAPATVALVPFSIGDRIEATGLATQGDSGEGEIVSISELGFVARCEDGQLRGAAWGDVHAHHGEPVAMLV